VLRIPSRALGSLRTTNPIQGAFARVRHGIVRTKGSLSPPIAKLMVLLCAVSKAWRRLKGTKSIAQGHRRRREEGVEIIHVPANHTA
jgi:hypothetical protein